MTSTSNSVQSISPASEGNTNAETVLAELLHAHDQAHMENEIAVRIRDFIIETRIASRDEIELEPHPADHDNRRVYIYVRNTFIEVKRDITNHGVVDGKHIDQLDGYLFAAAKVGRGVQNGILTDGKRWLERNLGEAYEPMAVGLRPVRIYDNAQQAVRLKEFLTNLIDQDEQDLAATSGNMTKYFEKDSPLFRASNQLLAQTYENNRDNPTVAVKRRLWQDLLQVALGKDAADGSTASDWLFIRHTYITSLIATIVQQQLLGGVTDHAANRPDDLLKGRVLSEQSALHGIVDADLFTWPTELEECAYLLDIAKQVERFDWARNAREVAPNLYQNVITQEERKKLGEYYTPHRLAKAITDAVVDDPLNQRVMDPACGSGTFIETIAERILKNSTGLTATETLRKLQDNIVGIDIHPVAVQLAKATWVMVAADTIKAARLENPDAEGTTAPIYLGDSMQLRYDTGNLSAAQTIELRTGEVLPGKKNEVIFSIPKAFANQQADIDRLITEIATALDDRRDAIQIIDHYDMGERDRKAIKNVAAQMTALHGAGKNHVWAYYIRNMIRPAVIAESKVDCIVGNPPWLTYAQSVDIMHDELRSMSEKRYQIWAG